MAGVVIVSTSMDVCVVYLPINVCVSVSLCLSILSLHLHACPRVARFPYAATSPSCCHWSVFVTWCSVIGWNPSPSPPLNGGVACDWLISGPQWSSDGRGVQGLFDQPGLRCGEQQAGRTEQNLREVEVTSSVPLTLRFILDVPAGLLAFDHRLVGLSSGISPFSPFLPS